MTETKACILDYGSGNVQSVFNSVSYLGYEVTVSNQPQDIKRCTHIILPGVGAFGASMKKIKRNIPITLLEAEVIKNKKPFLGICVGMQILGTKSFEFGEHSGLGWISGVVRKMDSAGLQLPHVGWNDINIRNESVLVDNLSDSQDFYFVNTYVFRPDDERHIIAETEYGTWFSSIIQKNNIFGVQFHPEKSQQAGHRLLKNFLKI